MIEFGKHKGRTIEWVKKHDIQYYKWCIKNRPSILTKLKVKNALPPEEINVIDIFDWSDDNFKQIKIKKAP